MITNVLWKCSEKILFTELHEQNDDLYWGFQAAHLYRFCYIGVTNLIPGADSEN